MQSAIAAANEVVFTDDKKVEVEYVCPLYGSVLPLVKVSPLALFPNHIRLGSGV